MALRVRTPHMSSHNCVGRICVAPANQITTCCMGTDTSTPTKMKHTTHIREVTRHVIALCNVFVRAALCFFIFDNAYLSDARRPEIPEFMPLPHPVVRHALRKTIYDHRRRVIPYNVQVTPSSRSSRNEQFGVPHTNLSQCRNLNCHANIFAWSINGSNKSAYQIFAI